ncbi:RNA-directed DNA polymerase (reverse transcriptase), partial [mine drainage metagenome]
MRQAKGAAGVDGATIAAIEAAGVDQFLADLKGKVEAGKYRPKPVRRVWIPKPGKREKRPLGIPVVADRVLQAAAKIVLEPIFEAGFLACSYGFRPRKDAHQAMEVVSQGVNRGARWVVEVDFKDYFGSLDQEILMDLIQKRVSDRRMLRLCRLWMRAGVMEDGVTRSTVAGVPQGGVISPLFANIYAHAIDEAWEREMKQLGTVVRYADDLIILCHSELAARNALAWLGEQAAHLHLTLHPEKTRIVDLREGREGFDFLGFHC